MVSLFPFALTSLSSTFSKLVPPGLLPIILQSILSGPRGCWPGRSGAPRLAAAVCPTGRGIAIGHQAHMVVLLVERREDGKAGEAKQIFDLAVLGRLPPGEERLVILAVLVAVDRDVAVRVDVVRDEAVVLRDGGRDVVERDALRVVEAELLARRQVEVAPLAVCARPRRLEDGGERAEHSAPDRGAKEEETHIPRRGCGR